MPVVPVPRPFRESAVAGGEGGVVYFGHETHIQIFGIFRHCARYVRGRCGLVHRLAGGLPSVGREPPHHAPVPLHVSRLLLPHERLPRQPRLRARQGDPVFGRQPVGERARVRAHPRRRGAGGEADRRVHALLRAEAAHPAEVQARRLHHRGFRAAGDRHPHRREARARPRPRVRRPAVGGAEARRSPAVVQQDALRDAPFLVEAGLHRPDAPLDRRRLHDRRPPDSRTASSTTRPTCRSCGDAATAGWPPRCR